MIETSHSESVIRDRRIKVHVLFFGAARDAAGQREVDLELIGPTDAADAFAQVVQAYPELRRFGRSLLFAVNQEYAPGERTVQDGDELALFPPVSGGDGADAETRRRGDTATDETTPANAGSAGILPASTLTAHEAVKTTHDFFELTTDPIDVG